MKQTIWVIGDRHGHLGWPGENICDYERDIVVFLGDYWDSFSVPFEEQMRVFKMMKASGMKGYLLIYSYKYGWAIKPM